MYLQWLHAPQQIILVSIVLFCLSGDWTSDENLVWLEDWSGGRAQGKGDNDENYIDFFDWLDRMNIYEDAPEMFV